jgi:hypothetical protein
MEDNGPLIDAIISWSTKPDEMEYIEAYKKVVDQLRMPDGRWCTEFFEKWRSLICEKTGLDIDLETTTLTRLDIAAAAHVTAVLVAREIGYKGCIVSQLTAIKNRIPH